MLLLFGTILITLRTVIAFVTGSAFLYFAQPTAGTVAISLALLVSAVVGRPFTQRFAHDFCPMDPAIMKRPLVRRFFIRISVLWATVLMLNAGLVFWLLVSSSLRSFVLERSVVTYGLTAIAIFFSITGFMAMMRRDGITVQWAKNTGQFGLTRNSDAPTRRWNKGGHSHDRTLLWRSRMIGWRAAAAGMTPRPTGANDM